MRSMRLAAPILATFACFNAVSTAASAGVSPGSARFRVLFERGSSTLPKDGPVAAVNSAAMMRIAKVFERIGGLRGIQFVFVASRPPCEAAGICEPNRLTWERLHELALAAGAASKTAGSAMPYRNLEFTFADEPGLNVTLPAVPANRDALTLFLERTPAAPPPATCQAQVLVRDPDLPPQIGSGESAIPLADAEHAGVGPGSVLAALGPGQSVHAVWQDGSGRLRKEERPSGGFHPLPPGAIRLYILAARSESPELTRFLAGLGDDFAFSPLPSFLPGTRERMQTEPDMETALLTPRDRAVGDDARAVKPGTVRPAPDQHAGLNGETKIAVCEYGISAMPPLDDATAAAGDDASSMR